MPGLLTRTESASNGALTTSSSGTNQSPLDFGSRQVQSPQHVVQPAQAGSGDSLQQVGQPRRSDEADIVWAKMQTLKVLYLQDMRDLYAMLSMRSQQHMPEDQRQKLIHYKNVVQRMIPYLTASKGSLPRGFEQDKCEAFEKQIVVIMETFKRRRTALTATAAASMTTAVK